VDGAAEPPRFGAPSRCDCSEDVGGKATDTGARPRRLDLADDPLDFPVGLAPQLARVERGRTGHQFVQQHAEGVDVGAGVDVGGAGVGLLGAHVLGRADELVEFREEGSLGQPVIDRLGDAEVDDLRDGPPVLVDSDQDVGRLEVAVDDGLLVGVLHGATDLGEQLETFGGADAAVVAVLGDGLALDQLHHEIGLPRVGRPAVEHLGDVWVVHQGERLPLGLEARNRRRAAHPRLDDLDGHAAGDGVVLVGEVDDAHAALADLTEEPIPAPDRIARGGRDVRLPGVERARQVLR
jgi:hypothetical protein